MSSKLFVVPVMVFLLSMLGAYAGGTLAKISEPCTAVPMVAELRAPEPTACPMVQVLCECPAYEQGWDDAEHARGEIEDERGEPENLERMCEEFAEFEEPDC